MNIGRGKNSSVICTFSTYCPIVFIQWFYLRIWPRGDSGVLNPNLMSNNLRHFTPRHSKNIGKHNNSIGKRSKNIGKHHKNIATHSQTIQTSTAKHSRINSTNLGKPPQDCCKHLFKCSVPSLRFSDTLGNNKKWQIIKTWLVVVHTFMVCCQARNRIKKKMNNHI